MPSLAGGEDHNPNDGIEPPRKDAALTCSRFTRSPPVNGSLFTQESEAFEVKSV